MPGVSPQQFLQQGLTALQRGDYAAAVQHFSSLSRDRTVPGALRLKAHIGWIKALKADGQTAAAIAGCQKLVNHPQPKVKQWAIDTLTALTSGADPATAVAEQSNDISGFRPLDAEAISTEAIAEPAPAAPTASPPNSEQSRRSALNSLHPEDFPAPAPTDSEAAAIAASESPSITAPDNSGFQLLDDAADAVAVTPAVPASDPNIPDTNIPDTNAEDGRSAVTSPVADQSLTAAIQADGPTAPISDQEGVSAAVNPARSLFHYEQLNNPAMEATAAPAVPPSEPETSAPPVPVVAFQSAARLKALKSLPLNPYEQWQAWISQGICAIALCWLCQALVHLSLGLVATLLTPLTRVLPFSVSWLERNSYTGSVILALIALMLASPWLLDWLLRRTANLQSLPVQRLQKTHPEGCRLLRRITQKRGWLMPRLQELPTASPLIFSYGWLPRYTHIVISRGLLDRLTDEEVATLIGYELAHVTTRTLPWMSLVAVLLQFCHQGYWLAAQWGDRQSQRLNQVAAAMAATLCYFLYWLFRKANVLAARSQVLLSDRQAVVWTGNPNALMRALIKLETGIAEVICQTGYTPPLVESTDLFTPIGYEAAIGLGSLFPGEGFLAAIAWDIHNPYRRWLSLNSSHFGLGMRLQRLTGYALKWRLQPALPLPELPPQLQAGRSRFGTQRGAFLLQISPYIGPLLGIAVAMLLWFLGGVFEPLGLRRVGWIYGDRSVLWGILLLGLGMGIMLRINAYFPDITAGNRLKHPALPSLYENPLALPTVSQPVRLKGKLLGRAGMANWLCQDLIIETPSGLLKLHFLSALGALGNTLTHPRHPSEWVGRHLEVQGWYRRGAIAWLDIEGFFQNGKLKLSASHPIWSAALCLGSCALGLLSLIRG
ncbi:MAG: M48 family metalloprotease [Leptolyngbyaceae cyanobacterium]